MDLDEKQSGRSHIYKSVVNLVQLQLKIQSKFIHMWFHKGAALVVICTRLSTILINVILSKT